MGGERRNGVEGVVDREGWRRRRLGRKEIGGGEGVEGRGKSGSKRQETRGGR